MLLAGFQKDESADKQISSRPGVVRERLGVSALKVAGARLPYTRTSEERAPALTYSEVRKFEAVAEDQVTRRKRYTVI